MNKVCGGVKYASSKGFQKRPSQRSRFKKKQIEKTVQDAMNQRKRRIRMKRVRHGGGKWPLPVGSLTCIQQGRKRLFSKWLICRKQEFIDRLKRERQNESPAEGTSDEGGES